MKIWQTMSALIIVAVLLCPSNASGEITNPGAPGYTNNMMTGFVTPTVSPGETVYFSFNLTNPYGDPQANMLNTTLTMGIYRYATQDEVRDLDDDFENPPVFSSGTTETELNVEHLVPGETVRMSLDISTSKDTPHGSYFSQSTYFVRFRIEFQFQGNSSWVVLQSRGYFTDEEWSQMVSFDSDQSLINLTYMKSLGVDGLLPDSSFGIKVPIPRWPLAVLIAACCGVSFMALYYFVMDNPSKYPRLEKRFYQLRGKLSQFRSHLEHRRRQ